MTTEKFNSNVRVLVPQRSIPDYLCDRASAIALAKKVEQYYTDMGHSGVVTRIIERRYPDRPGYVTYEVRSNLKFIVPK